VLRDRQEIEANMAFRLWGVSYDSHLLDLRLYLYGFRYASAMALLAQGVMGGCERGNYSRSRLEGSFSKTTPEAPRQKHGSEINLYHQCRLYMPDYSTIQTE